MCFFVLFLSDEFLVLALTEVRARVVEGNNVFLSTFLLLFFSLFFTFFFGWEAKKRKKKVITF